MGVKTVPNARVTECLADTAEQVLIPGMQMQVNSPMRSRQVASFWQGMDKHSLMSISQRGPA